MSARIRNLLDTAQVYSTQDEWLEGRKAYTAALSCSDIAAILLGEAGGAYYDGWTVWARQHAPELLPPDDSNADNEDFQRGHDLEPAVLRMYERKREVSLFWPWKTPHVIFDGTDIGAPWLRGSPDHFAAMQPEGEIGGVEVKTTRNHHEWATSQKYVVESWTPNAARLVPPRVALQVYGYLAITGLPWWDVVACMIYRGLELRVVRILRNEALQTRIIDKLDKWREVHLIRGEAPAFSSSAVCRQYSDRKQLNADKRMRTASTREAWLMRQVDDYKKAERDNRRRADAARNELASLIGEDYGCRLNDRPSAPKATLSESSRESVSLKRLRAEAPDIYDDLKQKGIITTSRSRRLKVSGLYE